jgi:hypothetical protein
VPRVPDLDRATTRDAHRRRFPTDATSGEIMRAQIRRSLLSATATLAAALALGAASPARAGEMLVNGNFEDPAVIGEGNHVDVAPTGFSLDQGQFNLVRDKGNQYVDLTGPTGGPTGTYVYQQFTLSERSDVDFSAAFSPRDGSAGSGGNVAIYDQANTTELAVGPRVENLTAADTGFITSEGFVTLDAGTYTFRAFLDDPANVDNASVLASPAATPEPATAGFAAVVAAAALLRRARRRQA